MKVVGKKWSRDIKSSCHYSEFSAAAMSVGLVGVGNRRNIQTTCKQAVGEGSQRNWLLRKGQRVTARFGKEVTSRQKLDVFVGKYRTASWFPFAAAARTYVTEGRYISV